MDQEKLLRHLNKYKTFHADANAWLQLLIVRHLKNSRKRDVTADRNWVNLKPKAQHEPLSEKKKNFIDSKSSTKAQRGRYVFITIFIYQYFTME